MEILENRPEWEAAFKTGFAAHYAEHGSANFDIYNRANNSAPPAGQGVDLGRSRLLFISTAGAYLKDSQQPFDAQHPLGDYTHRLVPMDTPFDAIAYAHEHYDHQFVDADPQVLLPFTHLADMVQAGRIGSLVPQMFSYAGYTPDLGRVVDELVPALIAHAKDQQADAALLVPA